MDKQNKEQQKQIEELNKKVEENKKLETKKEAVETEKKKVETLEAGWKKYTNTEIGVSFNYPEKYGEPVVSKTDFNKEKSDVMKGQYTIIEFGGKLNEKGEIEKTGKLRFVAASSDYSAYFDLPQGESCKNPLEYDEYGNVCKVTKVNGMDIIYSNNFNNYECGASFTTKGYFENSKNSKYAKLSIFVSLEDVLSDLNLEKYPCEDMNKDVFKNKIKQISKNIINRENLTEKDKNSLENLDKIFNSIKLN